jgi:sigma-B regulation protein RsbU (phosphoserine phosphatase)
MLSRPPSGLSCLSRTMHRLVCRSPLLLPRRGKSAQPTLHAHRMPANFDAPMEIRTWSHAPRDLRSPVHRQTIGLVIDSLVDGYQRILFDAIARTARGQGVNVVAFTGGKLPSPLFDLIGPGNVDALIVVGSTVAHQVGVTGAADFCRRFQGLPICSIGIAMDGIPSVTTTGRSGVHALVSHLMVDHGRRNLAFIRGLGPDDAERFEAYRTCLNEFGVPLRDNLIVDGDFTVQGGATAIRVLCDERRVRFDGVVACDDYMALGAIDALEGRGFAVPKDVAVVGFDDIEEARNSVVPLTTVQQPIRELGRRAVEVSLQQLANREPGPVEPIICHPVKRRSCGCVVETPFTRRPSNLATQYASFDAALTARRDLVLADMVRTAQGELGSVGYRWEERLFHGIVEELRGVAGNPFLSANEELARSVFRSAGDVSSWQRVLSALRYHVLDCVASDRHLRSVAENAFHDAFLVSANVVGREQHHRRTNLEQLLRTVIQTGNDLIASADKTQTGPLLVEHLRLLGIGSCYVALFLDDGRSKAQLVLGFDQRLAISEVVAPAPFDAQQLVPNGLLPGERDCVYALLPLVYEGNLLGFALFEYDEQDTILFEVVRDQLSGALRAGLP